MQNHVQLCLPVRGGGGSELAQQVIKWKVGLTVVI